MASEVAKRIGSFELKLKPHLKIETSLLKRKIDLLTTTLMISRHDHSFGKMDGKQTKQQHQIVNVMDKTCETSQKIDFSKTQLSSPKREAD
ncbi:hypothetical protein FC82_GL002510 [Secundilactobacillus collinoides DSM 20515 = JCM 1123]|uniref:Uncharacterized protein n=1 Tax=Secundilactobacillus collinoides DSM 20515 = JCM 1123 TaxID=1423733 RepID=A0A0R2B913_SECCO|nr:hypothetical protein FC82_GL002510 [Secundilactobacillus collinoides DSM 20515 = JCM 1123]